jgi:hypothetical protein
MIVKKNKFLMKIIISALIFSILNQAFLINLHEQSYAKWNQSVNNEVVTILKSFPFSSDINENNQKVQSSDRQESFNGKNKPADNLFFSRIVKFNSQTISVLIPLVCCPSLFPKPEFYNFGLRSPPVILS